MIIKLISGKELNVKNVSIEDNVIVISDKKSELIIPLSRIKSILKGIETKDLLEHKKKVDA